MGMIAKNGWSESVHASLTELIKSLRGPIAASNRSTEMLPGPVVVFDMDQTCLLGDIGEQFGTFCIEEMAYRYDLEAFWELIDLQDGRDTLRRMVDELWELPREERLVHPVFEPYVTEMSSLYARKWAREGKAACYAWAVRLHVGMDAKLMIALSQKAFVEALCRPNVSREIRKCSRGDEVVLVRGIRVFEEVLELIDAFRRSAALVYIVSATNQWTVRALQPLWQLPEAHLLGNRVSVRHGTLTDELVEPAHFGPGKRTTVERGIGKTPILVAGDSESDFEMLDMASELALVIDHGDSTLGQHQGRAGWQFQPYEALTPLDAEALRQHSSGFDELLDSFTP